MFRSSRKFSLLQNRLFGNVAFPKKAHPFVQRPLTLQSVRCMSGGSLSERETAISSKGTLNDLPVPQGDWQEYHNKRNSTWNALLAASAAFFGITMYICYKGRVFYLNLAPDYKSIKVDATKNTEFDDIELCPPSGETSEEATSSTDQTDQSDKSSPGQQPAAVPVDINSLPEIPTEVPYLIIGAGTAAVTAFKAIGSHDLGAKILLVTEEDQLPYMRPPLSKDMWFSQSEELTENLRYKQWDGKENSIFYENQQFYCTPQELPTKVNGGIAVATGKKVVKLDVRRQVAILSDGTEIKYGKCLLATGGNPRILPVLEKGGEEVKKRTTLFRNIADFKQLYSATSNIESVAVIGGGFLGSELACGLGVRAQKKKFKVYQTFPESGNMGMVLPEYLSKWSMEKVRKEGVDVKPGTMVVGCSFNEANKKVVLKLDNGEELSVDHVVCAVGLEPNVELAKSAGLEVDKTMGGFLVNAELEARTNVWVAGDAACFYDTQLGRRRVEHHDHAVVSGRLAGINMTGGGKPYSHQSMFWSDLGPEVGYEAIGVVDAKLPTVGVFAKATEEDTPEAEAKKTGEGLRSETQRDVAPDLTIEAVTPQSTDNYGKGVIFYVRDSHVVGLVMWNVFGKMPIARKILKDQIHEDKIPEAAKLFNLHGVPKSPEK